MRQAIWFVAGIISGGGLTAGTLALADVGDLIYQDQKAAVITTAEAACYKACAVADETWDGAVGDVTSICGSRIDDDTWQIVASGLKIAAPDAVPVGVETKGYVEAIE